MKFANMIFETERVNLNLRNCICVYTFCDEQSWLGFGFAGESFVLGSCPGLDFVFNSYVIVFKRYTHFVIHNNPDYMPSHAQQTKLMDLAMPLQPLRRSRC